MNWILRLAILVFLTSSAYAEPIKIGALLDLSKEYSMESNAFREGIQLAAAEVNASGGINGEPLELIVEDTQYNMKNVLTASKKLITFDKVKAAVIGTYTEVMVAGPVFEKAQIPLVNIWDSAPEIEALGDYVFGIGVWTPSSTDESVRFAREKLKAKTAVTVCSNGEWSLEVAKGFQEKFTSAGGKVLEKFELNPNESDFRTVLLKIKNLSPDVLYAPVTDNIAAFWLQLARSGYHLPVMTSDILNQEILNQLNGAANGVYQTQAADPVYEKTKAMVKKYKEHFQKDCTQVFFTSLGYDSLMFLSQAMREKGTLGTQIKKGLYALTNYPGASGPANMTPEGSVRRMVSVFQVQNNKLQVIH